LEWIIVPSTYKVQTIPYDGVPFANCIFEAMNSCDVFHFSFVLEVSIGIKPPIFIQAWFAHVVHFDNESFSVDATITT
jgi:hypothetical protein